MSTNYIAEGKVITITAGADITKGAPYLVGEALVGVCPEAIANGSQGEMAVCGIWDVSVKGIDGGGDSAVAIGDKIYYTTGDTPHLNKKTTGVYVGIALEAVTSGGTDTIKVKLASLG